MATNCHWVAAATGNAKVEVFSWTMNRLIIALLSDANNQELVAATAAYAAVLVVFVGTTAGSS